MKKCLILLITIALFAVMFAGCTNSKPALIETSTSTPAPATMVKDSIIGVWKGYDSYVESRYRFNSDGTYIESHFNTISKETIVNNGTWSAQAKKNSYGLQRTGENNVWIIMHDPDSDVIYDEGYMKIVLTSFPGDVMAASTANVTSTIPARVPVNTAGVSPPVVTQSSNSQVPTTLTGSGNDIVSFTATGTGPRIFTMEYTGGSNFIVWLKDGEGKEITALATEIGLYSGNKSERLSTGKYYLDVKASGHWVIDITSV